MAQPIYCDVCSAEPARILVTIIDGGDVTGLGANCAVSYLRAMADTIDAVQNTPPEGDQQEEGTEMPTRFENPEAPIPADEPAPGSPDFDGGPVSEPAPDTSDGLTAPDPATGPDSQTAGTPAPPPTGSQPAPDDSSQGPAV